MMKQTHLLKFFCLVATGTIGAEERSLFSYHTQQALSSQVRALQDIVVMKDGTQVQATLGGIPSLSFTFGKVAFQVEDVTLFSTLPDSPGHVLVKTRNGQLYIGSSNEQYLRGTERGGAAILPLKEVSFALIKPRNEVEPLSGSQFHVTLQNGETFPVGLPQGGIEVSTGWDRRRIPPHTIQSLAFNGGVYGTLIGEDGLEEQLPLSFATNPFLTVTVPSQPEMVKIPWNQVVEVHRGAQLENERFAHIVKKEARSQNKPEPLFSSHLPEDLEGEIDFNTVPKPIFAGSEVEEDPFLLVLGEDFNVDEWGKEAEKTEKEKAESEEDEVEFISVEEIIEEQEIAEDQLAYREEGDEGIELPSEPPQIQNKAPSADTYVPFQEGKASGFYIKSRKVTHLEYQAFVRAIHYKPPVHWINGQIPPGLEEEPVTNVSYKDAFLYAVWAGKRLPSQNELERAMSEDSTLLDRDDRFAEWTSTPALREESLSQAAASARIGVSFSALHEVFSSEGMTRMRNDDFNSRTGFRLAYDAY